MNYTECVRERKRMCESHGATCDGCPMKEHEKGGLFGCTMLFNSDPETYEAIVEKWSKENPLRTRLSELLKVFPDTSLKDDGTPNICVKTLGINETCHLTTCKQCWNKEV